MSRPHRQVERIRSPKLQIATPHSQGLQSYIPPGALHTYRWTLLSVYFQTSLLSCACKSILRPYLIVSYKWATTSRCPSSIYLNSNRSSIFTPLDTDASTLPMLHCPRYSMYATNHDSSACRSTFLSRIRSRSSDPLLRVRFWSS